ncbi:MAG: glycosyltransferase [Parcubacteria group bacterium]
MRIGIFTNNYLPNPYGVTQSVESFRKQFEKLGPASNASPARQPDGSYGGGRSDAGRHEVFIFAPKWKGYADENPHVFRYPSISTNIKFKFPLAIPYSRKMDKIIEKLDLDIIHSQHPNLLGTAAAKWARKKKIPLVFTWHTLYDKYAHFVVIIPEKLAAWWTIRNAKNYANQADYIIAPTQSVKEIIKNWGVTNKNIKAISSGVEEEIYQKADKRIIRNKFAVKDGEILLLLVSRLTSEKNIEFLFRAVIKVLKKNENAKFLVAGDGDLVPGLKLMARENNLEDRIFFAGIVDKAEIKNYYAAGDIFVYASKSETQGMIITEAMYLGLPIVAVNAPGICDLVEDNINGFLVSGQEEEFANAVNKLISDADLRKKFSEASAKIARENYTDKICAEKLLHVYEKAIASYSK